MFDVVRFQRSSFKKLIQRYSSGISSKVADKKQFLYLINYLEAIHAKTIVIEHDYLDSHYLQDYVEYYSSSYFENGRSCVRIHFFDGKSHSRFVENEELFGEYQFTEEHFRDLVLGGYSPSITEESLQSSYLGFLIIKPLQETILGKTCLKLYDSLSPERNNEKLRESLEQQSDDAIPERERCYRSLVEVKVNLFGLELKIDETLPFQEQDRVISECATSALWSYFYASNTSSPAKTPSPAAIYRAANKSNTPKMPNDDDHNGLDYYSISKLLVNFGIQVQSYEIKNNHTLNALILAYLEYIGQPVLLGLDVYKRIHKQRSPDKPDSEEGTIRMEAVGSHLVVVGGYGKRANVSNDWIFSGDNNSKENQSPNISHEKVDMEVTSDRSLENSLPTEAKDKMVILNEFKQSVIARTNSQEVDALYVHDDQIGPFAKLKHFRIAREDVEIVPPRERSAEQSFNDNFKNNNLTTAHRLSSDFTFLRYEVLDDKGHNVLDDRYYVPHTLITGFSSKVNSKYFNIQEQINALSSFLEPLEPIFQNCLWKVCLHTSNSYKKQLRESFNCDKSGKNISYPNILIKNLPRYIWVCEAYDKDNGKYFDVVLDATDVHTLNSAYMGTVVFDNGLIESLHSTLINRLLKVGQTLEQFISNGEISVSNHESNAVTEIIEEFIHFIYNPYKPLSSDNRPLIGELFGHVLSPLYIKEEEENSGEIVVLPDIMTVSTFDKSGMQISELSAEGKYIWLLDRETNFIFAAEKETYSENLNKNVLLGHPTLNDGDGALMAGEFEWDNKRSCWLFSNASGRYCSFRYNRGKQQLDTLIHLLKARQFINGENECFTVETPFHSNEEIGSVIALTSRLNEITDSIDSATESELENNLVILTSSFPTQMSKFLSLSKAAIDKLANKEIDLPDRFSMYFVISLISERERRLEESWYFARESSQEIRISSNLVDYLRCILEASDQSHKDFYITLQLAKRILNYIFSLEMSSSVEGKTKELVDLYNDRSKGYYNSKTGPV